MQNIPRILFVDDHDDTRFMIKFWLAQFDYQVETAGSLASGLMMAQYGAFDLFVFDSIFPDGSGAELCSQVENLIRERRLSSIPEIRPNNCEWPLKAGRKPG